MAGTGRLHSQTRLPGRKFVVCVPAPELGQRSSWDVLPGHGWILQSQTREAALRIQEPVVGRSYVRAEHTRT